MLPRGHALTIGAIIVLAGTSVVVPIHVHAGALQSPVLLPSRGFCCLPSQVAKAEERLPVHPFNPQAIVQSVTHLKLVNFDVSTTGHMLALRSRVPNTIQYYFGFTPPTRGNLAVKPRPRFVVVTEIVEKRASSSISIAPVLRGGQQPPIPPGYYSPLLLVAPLPQRRLTFLIESNIPRSRLYLLGELLRVHTLNRGCLLFFPSGGVTCFGPRHLAQAEHMLLRRPVSPVAVVSTMAHLPLIQVIVAGFTGGSADSIHYIFERVRRNLGDIPGIYVRGHPKFVAVDEFTSSDDSPHPRFGRACQAPSACSNWQFQAGIPGRQLDVLVTSNLPPREVRGIGNALLIHGARGK